MNLFDKFKGAINRLSFLLIKGQFKAIGSGTFIEKPLKITPANIVCGNNVLIAQNARIQAYPKINNEIIEPIISIGNNVYIGQNAYITCGNRIQIGDNTCITANVTITDIIHPYKDINQPAGKQKVYLKQTTIGKDCCIYNNAVILPGVQVGNHCVVGANSVVTKDVPDYSVVAGNPAIIIKQYSTIDAKWIELSQNHSGGG